MRAPRGRRRDDTGAATAYLVVLSGAFLALAGLVVDGGLALNARQQVADDVEQAARAGAQQIDVATLRANGNVVLLQGVASDAALAFLGTRGYPGADVSATATPTEVDVVARRTVPTALLGLVGVQQFTVQARASARAAVGITAEVP